MKATELAKKALKISCDDFVELTERTVQLLSKEQGRVGNMEIVGKLVRVKPSGNAVILGDIHGDLESLVQVLSESRFLEKAEKDEEVNLIFLGDYGDRGERSAEVYYIVLRLKESFPDRVVLMRGNHEGPEDLLAYPHDLPLQLRQRFGEDWLKAYRKLRKLFDCLYNAVQVEERYLMIHGGIPSHTRSIEDLAYAHLKHPRETLLEEMLWSDPMEGIRGTYSSPRGAGRLFGEDVTRRLLEELKVKILIRGHEPCKDGYKINHGGKVLTLFSRKGPPYFNERGAYLDLDLSKKLESAKQLLEFIHQF